MKVYPRQGHWQVEFEHNGKRLRLAVGLKVRNPDDPKEQSDVQKAAVNRMQSFYTSLRVPETARVTDQLTSLAEALQRCYLTRWRNATSAAQMNCSMNQLTAQVGHWMLKELSFNKLFELQQQWIRDGQRPATVNRKFSLLRTAIRLARQLDTSIPEVPFPSRIKEDNVKDRYLTDEEAQRVEAWLIAKRDAEATLRNAGAGDTSDWQIVYDAYIILIDTGMRLGELLQLSQEHLQYSNGELKIELRKHMTKSKKPRVIPLLPRTVEAAKRWLTYPKLKSSWLQHRWKLVRRECSVKDVNVHILRHTCAVRLLRAGVGIYTVAKWLGHSSVKITERYSSMVPDMLDDALARLTRSQSTSDVISMDEARKRRVSP